MIELSASLMTQIVKVLLSTFKWEDLVARVMRPLKVPDGIISESYDLDERVKVLVRWARDERRVEDLVRTARQANHSPQLEMLAESLGLAPASLSLVDSLGAAVVDPVRWQAGLVETQRQVCLVRADSIVGTGFLVGPDQVMTHRTVFPQHQDQLEVALPDSPIVVQFDDMPQSVPATAVLFADKDSDVVVLRLAQDVGRALLTAGRAAGTAARARGWIRCRPGPDLDVGAPVAVVQQASGGPVRLAIDVAGFVGVEGSRIRYRTATHAGSTGAPCFDINWQLIGMHALHPENADWNEGVSVDAILRDLAAHGLIASPSEGFIRAQEPRSGALGGAALAADIAGASLGATGTLSSAPSLDDVLKNIDVSAHDDTDLDAWDLGDDVSEGSWAWAEAASVVASYVPEALKPLRAAPDHERVAVQLESQPSGSRWIISDKLRAASLRRLERRGELRKARTLNAGEPGDPLDALLGAFIAGESPSAARLRDAQEIRAMQRVVSWLDGVIAPLPSVAELSAQLERATLLAPFRHLTRGFFAGREAELARLSTYVEAPSSATPAKPVFIHAAGGMGKSALLSHFILANAERDPSDPAGWRPFVYLDFDRPDLDARSMSTVLVAIVRQLGPQVPSIAAAAHEIVQRERTLRYTGQKTERTQRTVNKGSIRSNLTPRRPVTDMSGLQAEVASFLRRAGSQLKAPILLVFDTLEEAQYADPDAIAPLIDLAVALRREAPWVRPVLAGRIEPRQKALKARLDAIALQPLLQAAREALLGNQLPAAIAAHPDIVSRMAEIVGGNPLSLRLAAEVLRRTTDVEKLLTSFDDVMSTVVSDALVQGQLYERIVEHVDRRVQAIAVPGLIVRTLTWEVIRDVLAGPCGLGPLDDAAAKQLFELLAAEVALVRQGDSQSVLELRPELRRVVLESLHKDPGSQQKQRLIHEAAVAFYARRFAARSQPEDRAEEIYHRLALDQDPREVDRLWIRGVDHLLETAVDDLSSERARSYLATRVGLVADDDMMRTADAREWEVWAERRAGDLLRFRSAARALEILAMRAERTPASRLHLVESVVRRTLSPPDLDGAAVCARNAVGAARQGGDTSYLNEALEELVLVSRLRGDTGEALRGLAELGQLGDQLGDDLVVLEAATTALEAAVPSARSTQQFTDTAIRVFGRLPDELVARAPELARRIAAQVGAEDPATLQRVVRLVGTGSLSDESAQELNGILKRWSATGPDIDPFVPAPSAGSREISSAAQYLIANRPLDQRTSASLTGWLKTVVTPDLAKM